MFCNQIFERNLNGTRNISTDFVLNDFQVDRKDEHFIGGEEPSDHIPPLACCFSKTNGDIATVSDEEGGVCICDTTLNGPKSLVHSWSAHKNAVFDIDWSPTDAKLLTASGDQTVALWDAASTTSPLQVFRGHTSSVKTVRFRDSDSNVFVSGARDGHIMVYDMRLQKGDKQVNQIRNAHAVPLTGSTKKRKLHTQDSQQSVTSLVFKDEHTLLSAGSVDGNIKMWDLRKNHSILKTEPVPVHVFPYAGSSIRSHGYASLVIDSNKSSVFASCMDNTIYHFDCGGLSKAPMHVYRGHQIQSFYIRLGLSPDNNYIMSGSSDSSAYIWRVDNPRLCPLELRGHRGEVSAVAWCPLDLGKLVTTSDDSTMRVWRVKRPTDVTPDIGQIVGQAHKKHKDIGICADEGRITRARQHTLPTAESPKCMPSPRKGTMLPTSPTKLSPSVKNSLAAMSRGAGPGSSQKLVSPAITKWLTKSQTKESPSKQRPTPKKLVISPLKTPSRSVHSSNVSNTPKSNRVQGVKRKLCHDSPASESKRTRKSLKSDNTRSPKSENKIAIDGITEFKKDHKIVRDTPTRARKTLFSPATTPLKSSNCDNQYSSPTMNLPNYVFDPQPRTPVARGSLTKIKSSANWLTVLGNKKQTVQTCDSSEAANIDENIDHKSDKGSTPKCFEKLDKKTIGTPISVKSKTNSKTPVSKSKNTPKSKSTPKGTTSSSRSTPKSLKNKDTPGRKSTAKSTPKAKSTPSNKKDPSTPQDDKCSQLKRRGSILQFFSPKADK